MIVVEKSHRACRTEWLSEALVGEFSRQLLKDDFPRADLHQTNIRPSTEKHC